ncbi:MAG: very short patch repair endonuclease [Limisphaerales bacterium]
MADIVSKAKRSEMMSHIRGKNTKPELAVRKFLHAQGFRFRLHYRKLPGKPDVVLPKHKTVIFVHGCFWHRHKGCKFAYDPKSRKVFWQKKFRENVERDKRNQKELRKQGWQVLVVWECEVANTKLLRHYSQLISSG